jgi:hypothetical protein
MFQVHEDFVITCSFESRRGGNYKTEVALGIIIIG